MVKKKTEQNEQTPGFTGMEDLVEDTVPVPEEISDTPAQSDDDLEKRMRVVLDGREVRTHAPTLLDFRIKESQRRRSVLIELDREVVEVLWNMWKDSKGTYDQEAFLDMLYRASSTRPVRIYKQVDPLSLDG